MTLLSVCQQVAAELFLSVPASIVGNSDQQAVLFLGCAQTEGQVLSRRPRNGWIQQQVEYTFTTVSGQNDYPLPSDFRSMIDDTLWDRTRFWKMRGPLSPAQWQLYKSSPIGQASVQRRWRIRNTAGTATDPVTIFSIDPIVTDTGSTLVFEYVTNAWCQSSAGVLQTKWLADTDTFLLDEFLLGLGLKWRVLNRLGLAYQDERDEYERQVDLAVARDGGAPRLDLATTPATFLLGPWNVPETGFGPSGS